MSIQSHGVFYPRCERLCCPHLPHAGISGSSGGGSSKQLPLAQPLGSTSPGPTLCCPVPLQIPVPPSRICAMPSSPTLSRARMPGHPPVLRWSQQGRGSRRPGWPLSHGGAGFWGNPEPKMSKEQLLHHPRPRETQMTWPGQSHFCGPDEMGHIVASPNEPAHQPHLERAIPGPQILWDVAVSCHAE